MWPPPLPRIPCPAHSQLADGLPSIFELAPEPVGDMTVANGAGPGRRFRLRKGVRMHLYIR